MDNIGEDITDRCDLCNKELTHKHHPPYELAWCGKCVNENWMELCNAGFLDEAGRPLNIERGMIIFSLSANKEKLNKVADKIKNQIVNNFPPEEPTTAPFIPVEPVYDNNWFDRYYGLKLEIGEPNE